MFPATRVAELLGTRYPIVQAPMAGGFTTPELVASVSNAGGLGSLAAAYVAPEELRDAIAAVRRLTDKPFGVNLFAPLPPFDVDEDAVAAMSAALAPLRAELALPEPETAPPLPPSNAADVISVVAEERVPVLSFTFGVPPLEAVKEAGGIVLGTATTTAEAVELEARGVDALVLQGSEAGGHRGTFLGSFDRSLVGGMALVPQVVDRVSVPVLLAGGIMDGRGIAAALALGAEGAQLGTAFLGCPESGTPEPHRRALVEATDETTAITDAYTGRPARAIRGSYVDMIEESGVRPLPFPLQAMVAQDIRSAAAERERSDLLFMLAGQSAGMARTLPAGELVETLVEETLEAIAAMSR
jgi:nitronate monooxygenase